MLSARLDHAAARVGMTRSLSLVGGGAKSVPDRFIVGIFLAATDGWSGRRLRLVGH
jgi:hypothetical protein